MATFVYQFEWDQEKAKANFNKHAITFERATQVFGDPLALSIPDEEHSQNEVRWITLGRDAIRQYVLVVHTFEQLSPELARVRLISARPPTRAEVYAYEEGQ